MKRKKILPIVFLVLLSSLLANSFLLTTSKANLLEETYLLFETIQTGSATDMIILVTPTSSFNNSEVSRSLRITFSGGLGNWCQANNALVATGITSSAIDTGNWTIGAALPGTLTASCNQSSSGDYIEITGIGYLTGGTGYGVNIGANAAVFKTALTAGEHLVTIQLTEGLSTENVSFGLTLLTDNQVVVSAQVADSSVITCSLGTSSVNLGILYRGGAYTTGGMTLTTSSSSGFYWAIYGTGNGTNPGLYNSTGAGYLLSSVGVAGEVDLLNDEGFGLLASTSEGYVPTRFSSLSSGIGIFGSIGMGIEEAGVFLYGNPPSSTVNTTVYFGARANTEALEGSYQETLTYVCGGYVGSGGDIEVGAALAEGYCSFGSIGDECGGGIVAYHDGVGGGLIAHSTDNSTGIQWGCRGTSVGSTSSAYGTGLANTNTIVNFHEGWSEPWETGPLGETCNSSNNGTVAARVCSELSSGGYDDWYLPSLDELNALFCHIGSDGTEAYWNDPSHANCTQYPDFSSTSDANGNIGNFAATSYWTPTEYNTSNAWYQYFVFGYQNFNSKNDTNRVRCIRAF